jgi:hypothetical protein
MKSQTDRLVDFLREHSGASSLDLIRALGIVNTTGRISDARRALGDPNAIVAYRDEQNVWRYRLDPAFVRPTRAEQSAVASYVDEAREEFEQRDLGLSA